MALLFQSHTQDFINFTSFCVFGVLLPENVFIFSPPCWRQVYQQHIFGLAVVEAPQCKV